MKMQKGALDFDRLDQTLVETHDVLSDDIEHRRLLN